MDITIEAVPATILGLAMAGIGLYLRSYIVEKARGFATREDITLLTRTVEGIRTEFRLQEEVTKSVLARDATAHRLRLETELPIYRELWNRLIELDKALTSVRIAAQCGVSPEGKSHSEAYSAFRLALQALQEAGRQMEPFFPRIVRGALLMAQLPLREIAVRQAPLGVLSAEESEAQLADDTSKIVAAMKIMSDAIEERLFADTIEAERLAVTLGVKEAVAE